MEEPIRSVDSEGTIYYILSNGLLHRNDGPAYITPGGFQEWCQNGKCHRTDGPAIIYPDGTKWWYQNGKLHRTDGPAVIKADGTEEFWLNDEQIDIMVHFLQRK